MAFFPRPVTRRMLSMPEATASSTTYWMVGLSTSGSISLGWALVTGGGIGSRARRPGTHLYVLSFDSAPWSGAQGGPLFAIEGPLDAAAQLVLRLQALVGLDLGQQAQHGLGTAPPDDTLRLRRLQRETALFRPLFPHPLEEGERPLHRHLARQGDLHDHAGPPAAPVGEGGELAVGEPVEAPVERAQPGDAQPDRFDRALMAVDLDHVLHRDQSLEQQEDAGDHVLHERLGA